MAGYYCKFEDCKKIPSFGVKNTKEAIYCVEHKEVDHVNIIDKTCLLCDKLPVFGIRGTNECYSSIGDVGTFKKFAPSS